jgi:hypothetical protein
MAGPRPPTPARRGRHRSRRDPPDRTSGVSARPGGRPGGAGSSSCAATTCTGLPESILKAKNAATWFAFVKAYTIAKWPHLAAKSRDNMTDALATVTPALTKDEPGRPDAQTLRTVLRRYALGGDARDRLVAEVKAQPRGAGHAGRRSG